MHLFWCQRNRVHDSLWDAHLAQPNVGGMEEDLRNGEPFVGEAQTLLVRRCVGFRGRTRWSHETSPSRTVVWEHILLHDCVALPFPLGHLHVAIEVLRDIAHVFLHLVHHMGLVHDLQLPVGDDLLEVIGQQFAAHVDPHHAPGNDPAPIVRDDVGEGETRVHHEGAERGGVGGGVVEIGQSGGRGAREGVERVFFEKNLAEGLLDGGEIEDGFGEDEVAVVGVNL